MRYVQAPQPYDGPGPVLFLAGGITGCPDWQAEAVAMLRDTPGLTVLDPRRAVFDVHVTRLIPLAVGADPGYPRRLDVEVQLALARPGLTVHRTLAATVAEAERLSSPPAPPMDGVNEP